MTLPECKAARFNHISKAVICPPQAAGERAPLVMLDMQHRPEFAFPEPM